MVIKNQEPWHITTAVLPLPPSTESQLFFVKLKGRQPSEDELDSCKNSTLSSIRSEIMAWPPSGSSQEQRGAAKAAETRRGKKTAKGVAESTTAQLQACDDPINMTNANGRDSLWCV